MSPERRDYVDVRQDGGRLTGKLPLVTLSDRSFEPRPHGVVFDDAERQLLAAALERQRRHGWAMQVTTAVASLVAGCSGIAAILLHYLAH